MNDTSKVLENREELAGDVGSFPLDLAPGSQMGIADKLLVKFGDKRADFDDSHKRILEHVQSLEFTSPRMLQLLDEQIVYWLRDLEKSPNNVYLMNNVGNAYLGRGKITDAIKYYSRAQEIDSKFRLARINLAKAYILLDKTEAAIEIYLGDIKHHPNDTRILMELAHACLRQKDLNKALEALDRIVCLDADNVAAHHNIGIIRLIQGHVDKAMAEFRKSISIDVRFAAGHNALGVCFALQGNYVKAVRHFQVSQTINSSLTTYTKNLAMVYQLMGEYLACSKILESYLEKYPRDLQARSIVALAHFKEKDYVRCFRHLEFLVTNAADLAVEKTQLASALNNLGVVCRRMGRQSDAEQMYRKALSISATSNPVTYFNLVKLYIDTGKQKQAKLLIDEYLLVSPNDPQALLFLSSYYCNREEFGEASQLLTRVLDINPRSKEARLLLSMIVGEVFEDYDTAVRISKEGLDCMPDDDAFLNNLSYFYLKKGLISEGKMALEQIKWDKTNFVSYATKGLLLILEGRIKEGARLYDVAANMAPNQEWKNLTNQKKRVELARHLASQGKRTEAVSLAKSAKLVKTRSFIFFREAERLLSQLGETYQQLPLASDSLGLMKP